MVRNGEKIISLAGISEAEKVVWSKPTKNILIEGAFFELALIKKTAQRLNISLSSNPFFSPREALAKFIALLTKKENNLEAEIIFTYKKTKKPLLVKVSQTFVEKKIGQSLPTQQIEKIWKQLNWVYSKKGRVY